MKSLDEIVHALMLNKKALAGPNDKYRIGRINALEWVLDKPESDAVEIQMPASFRAKPTKGKD